MSFELDGPASATTDPTFSAVVRKGDRIVVDEEIPKCAEMQLSADWALRPVNRTDCALSAGDWIEVTVPKIQEWRDVRRIDADGTIPPMPLADMYFRAAGITPQKLAASLDRVLSRYLAKPGALVRFLSSVAL